MCVVWVIVWVTAEVFTSLVLECKREQIERFQVSSWWNMPLFIRWNFTSKLEELDFADDIALISSCYAHMQTKIRQLNQFAARSGLRINKKKAQVLRINSRCENIVLIDDQELKEVDKFNFLGANVSKQGGGGENIVNIIRKANC